MNKTLSDLIKEFLEYLSEFHPVMKMDTPLFYATTHGVRHISKRS